MWCLCSIVLRVPMHKLQTVDKKPSPGQRLFLAQYFMNSASRIRNKVSKKDRWWGKKLSLHLSTVCTRSNYWLITRLFLYTLTRSFYHLPKGFSDPFIPPRSLTNGCPVFSVSALSDEETNRETSDDWRWEQSRKSGLNNCLLCLVLGYNCPAE